MNRRSNPGAAGARRGRALALVGALVVVVVVVVAGAVLLNHRRALRQGMLATPAPSTTADVAPPPPPPASTAAVPITVSLAPLASQLERAVPKRFGSLDERLPVRGVPGLTVALELSRGPLGVSFDGHDAVVHTTVRYALRAWYRSPMFGDITASCGHGNAHDPRLAVTVRGPVTIRPDWTLRTRARLTELRPASSAARDRCRVSSLGLDITDEVVRQARAYLESQAGALDTAVERLDLRAPVTEAWRRLEDPVALGDSLWLLVHPDSVQRGPVRGLGDSVEVTLALKAHPTVVAGARPEATDAPLPPLDSGTVSPRFDVRVEGRADYAQISRIVQRELGGTSVREVGRTVVLDSLRVFGIGGGKIAMEVRVGGDAPARLYMTGTPRLDATTGQVTIPDLDFDIRTRDLALRAASWLVGDRLRQVLRRQARWPAAAAVGRMRAGIERALNRELSPQLSVRGKLDTLRLDAVVATRDALVVQASASGSAALRVTRY